MHVYNFLKMQGILYIEIVFDIYMYCDNVTFTYTKEFK